MYDYYLTGISQSRHINKDSLFTYADQLRIKYPEDALKYKLIDGVKYKDEVLDELKKRTGAAGKTDLAKIDLGEYAKSTSKGDDSTKTSSKNRIAVVYASGEIIGGTWVSYKRPDFIWTKEKSPEFTGDLADLVKIYQPIK